MIRFPVVMSAPSGVGKTTIARLLLDRRGDVGYSVSCTTRQPRPGEVHGRDYFFWTPEQFIAARERGEFAESADVHGRMYGTLRREVDRVLSEGRYVIMDIDVQGAAQFAKVFPESVLIFLLPPSAQTLVERLEGRKSETPGALATRLRNAIDELREADRYHYLIVNDDLERAIRYVSSVIDAETVRRERDPEVAGKVASLISDLSGRIR
jgi:guanylate kinase